MRKIHISQSAIRDNTNLGTNDPVISVVDDSGDVTLHHEYDICEGVRVRYDPKGHWVGDTLVRVWVEIVD